MRAAAEHVFSPLGSRLMPEDPDKRPRNESSGVSWDQQHPCEVVGGTPRSDRMLGVPVEC